MQPTVLAFQPSVLAFQPSALAFQPYVLAFQPSALASQPNSRMWAVNLHYINCIMHSFKIVKDAH